MPQAADKAAPRLALVVATSSYVDPRLRALRSPARDAADLAEVLADPGIGGFTVTTVIDQSAQQIRLAVEDFMDGRGTADLLLVYLSCHGVLDARRRLYFAATDTRKDRLGATGVESAWLLDQLEHCRARRQVLILDSCFSGAFAHGTKGETDLGLGDRFLGQGRGRVVLTASTAAEYSFEGEPTDAATSVGSVFTTALVRGLRTGAADTDRDGYVSVDDAYAYVFDQVQAVGAAQTPQRWLYGAEGQILLARSPAGPTIASGALPESLRAGLDSPYPGIRIGAVTELGEWLTGGDAAQAATASRHLQEVADTDIPRVANIARTLLNTPAPAEQPAIERGLGIARHARIDPFGAPQPGATPSPGYQSQGSAGVPAPVLHGPQLPELVLSATVIDLGRIPQRGDSPEYQVRISNAGGGYLNARVAASADWLKLRQVGDDVMIAADTSAAGPREGTITVDSDGGSRTIRVYAMIDHVPLPTTATESTSVPQVPGRHAAAPADSRLDAARSTASLTRTDAPRKDQPGSANPAVFAAPSPLPSVDRSLRARMPSRSRALRIGRAPENDVVLPDLDVSLHHAELRRSSAGDHEVVDLGSHNGTYVNGRRVSSAAISENDIISIGHSTFRLAGGELRVYEDEGEVSFKAQDLVLRVGGKVLLNHVSFPVPENSLLGIIGPSGAGKSTLLGALTGMRPADTGTVLYDNRDLYANYAELKYRIGLVPQDSILHTRLTARQALKYSAELRFPADTAAAERDARVDEVMSELGLTRHANTRADRLSGGQLKLLNVAQELLTKPSLLFLDEPTSGLDPGVAKSVMEQMRDLAHDGRTVIVVTRGVANLDTCDRLLVLFPGGKVAYYGPPGDGLSFFGLPGWAEVFQAFERYPDRDWAGEFAASPQYQQYVADRQRPRQAARRTDWP